MTEVSMGSELIEKKQKQGATKREAAWAIRGVAPETQNAAKLAARRAGMTLGEWVDSRLRTAAMAEVKGPAVPAPTQEDTLKAILAQLEKRDADAAATSAAVAQLAAKVDQLAQQQAPDTRGFLARLFRRRPDPPVRKLVEAVSHEPKG
jgi:hypothetical protein